MPLSQVTLSVPDAPTIDPIIAAHPLSMFSLLRHDSRPHGLRRRCNQGQVQHGKKPPLVASLKPALCFSANASDQKKQRSARFCALRSLSFWILRAFSRHTRRASVPRLPFPSWERLEAEGRSHTDLPPVRSEESAGRRAFQGHRDGHSACPCPVAGRSRS
jgi:hypothetical protein